MSDTIAQAHLPKIWVNVPVAHVLLTQRAK